MQEEATITKRPGRIRKGWELTKSSWKVLKLDKELTAVPIIGGIVSLIALIPFLALGTYMASADNRPGFTFGGDNPVLRLTLMFGLYLVLGFVANFFSAVIAHAALSRFRGADPTIKGSIKAAWKRADSIFTFSLLSTTVGLALRSVEQRVPLAGKIAVWLFSAAWSVANVFTIPVIVTSDSHVGPFKAVRGSVQTFKRVWGESIVADFGIALIGVLTILAYGATSALIMGLLAVAGILNTGAALALGGVAILGLLGVALVLNVLSSIVRAAVYHYAVTGESPETFNKELLQAAMTPKKARKLFA